MTTARRGFDTVVVGGGLLGWSTAYQLVRRGQRIAVIDRADNGYATQAGAGIVAPGASLAAPEPFYPLAQHSVQAYDRLALHLAEDDVPDCGYDRPGMLFIARDDAEWERLQEAMRRMTARKAAGMGNLGALSFIDDAEAHRRFPPLMTIAGAIDVPDAARVNGRTLRDALRTASERRGATVINGDAAVQRTGDTVQIFIDDEPLTAESVVLASGAWSAALAEVCGFALPVYPQRGQILHFDLPRAETGNWPIIEWFGSHYMLTFPGGRVVTGATREHDSGYDVRMTAGGVAEVLNMALAIAPGLASSTLAEIRVGLRPFSPDSLPVLGRAPEFRNLFICTGHGPSGLTLGPGSGELIAALVAGESPALDLRPFDPARYQAGTGQRNASADTIR